VRNWMAALALTLPLIFIAQPAAALEAGKDYLAISPAQPTDSKGKVEVLEFFAYTCPHCFDLEPELHAWSKKLPKDVVLKRVPAVFSEKWEPMARAFYTLETLGALDKLHVDVFEALHVKNQNLTPPEAFFSWAAARDLDRKRVQDVYNSFGVTMKVARAKQLSASYKLSGVPALVVNGKYLTSGSMTGSHAKTLEAVDSLIAMERGSRAANSGR
jgi:protein dithiol oxidoreductase (disulfide-forming)